MQFISQLLIERNANSPVNRLKHAFLPEALFINCINFCLTQKNLLFFIIFLCSVLAYTYPNKTNF